MVSAIRDGHTTSRNIVESSLHRIEADSALAAWVHVDAEGALARADECDRLRQSGRPLGRLHGVPVGLKDIIDVAGMPCECGAAAMKGRVPETDARLVESLRAEGAVIIGKTNTPEFGTGSHTFNPVHGLTRNPWDLSRSAGGSSGGAAVALATRMLPIADGSDLGGSLRNPAAFNNVVGLRPSIGRVPLADPTTHRLARLSVQGPMGRTVGDVALILSALAGPDRRDPLALTDDPSSFASPLPTTMSATVGWIGDIDGAFACDDAPMAIARAAADVVTDAGGELVEMGAVLPGAEQIFRVVRGLGFRQLAADIPADRHHELKDTIRENMAYGLALTVDDIIQPR
ncbi:MAG: amidase [Actinobacteria bacterium]|nr:amidase [Actinomycetota bacterium]